MEPGAGRSEKIVYLPSPFVVLLDHDELLAQRYVGEGEVSGDDQCLVCGSQYTRRSDGGSPGDLPDVHGPRPMNMLAPRGGQRVACRRERLQAQVQRLEDGSGLVPLVAHQRGHRQAADVEPESSR